jgi:hypothetical protein
LSDAQEAGILVWGGTRSGAATDGKRVQSPLEGAFQLKLKTLTWQRATVPQDRFAIPSINWPSGWSAMEDADHARYQRNSLLHAMPPGHALFAADVRAWANCSTHSRCTTLFRLTDGTDRVATVEAFDWPEFEHAEYPSPQTQIFETIDEWLRFESA